MQRLRIVISARKVAVVDVSAFEKLAERINTLVNMLANFKRQRTAGIPLGLQINEAKSKNPEPD